MGGGLSIKVSAPNTLASAGTFRLEHVKTEKGEVLAGKRSGRVRPCAGEESNDAHTACVSCSDGYYSSSAGTMCTACPAGETSNSGHTACEDCDPGYVSGVGGTCTPCAAGRSRTGAHGVRELGPGTYSVQTSQCTQYTRWLRNYDQNYGTRPDQLTSEDECNAQRAEPASTATRVRFPTPVAPPASSFWKSNGRGTRGDSRGTRPFRASRQRSARSMRMATIASAWERPERE